MGDYTRAHLMETRARIKRALEASREAERRGRTARPGAFRAAGSHARQSRGSRGGADRTPPRIVAARAQFRAQSLAASGAGSVIEARPPAPPSTGLFSQESIVIAATQLKVGNVIMHNGKPHRVTNVLHVTPGNWRGMVQTRLVNIETGSNAEHRFRSEDKVERANMEQHTLQFSYRAGDDFHFMNTESYEMVGAATDVLGRRGGLPDRGHDAHAPTTSRAAWSGIEVPMFVELTVKETTPNIKGAAVQNTSKPAILETGLRDQGAALHRDRQPREDRHPHRGVRRAGLAQRAASARGARR